MKRYTDKQRLDYLQRLGQGTPNGFFMVNRSDGSIHRVDRPDDYEEWEECSPSLRRAIDFSLRKQENISK